MLKELVRDVPDYPKEGIIFKDITPLFRDRSSLKEIVDKLSERYSSKGVDVVVGAEARGFLIGPSIAMKLNAGFVPIRKPGKLPCETASKTYELEYGTDTLEIHKDAVSNNDSVLMVDDLLATGGTMAASCELVESLGAKIVGCAFIIELDFLHGKDKLGNYDVFSLIHY
ncbi:MAG: adenine phosphoribosyltransferase [Planctomycetes bacterium]|nr:adenine phosphoribosyltransferase [Planctomycetota bacterium]